ncbi:nucleotidyltransferase [Actinorugispora endophytica]|uniref:Putative nucleotidyltransferase n=1 Tax=Actinorugispora endophytica TaxID=1605990 RepID=A0A4R6UZV2_9ACTN|nr:nucleotidyltransferase [Actinorugispora endophytica]TDQ51563.1 putative nucleotidyltransferase [Actinorugispora endophytica]
MEHEPRTRALLTTLKRVAGAFKADGVPFALSGGFAAFARGAPPSRHDVDFAVLPEDAERALEVLAKAGLTPADTVEDWLVKAHDGDVLVDLIHSPSDLPVTRAMLDRATPLKVDSVHVPVLDATDLLVMRLRAFTEHECDFAGPLVTARALREQVDWEQVRVRVRGSPYALAFLVLLGGLDVISREESGMPHEAPQYAAGHLQQTLAEDPRTAEQGIRVRVVGEDVYLSGEVSCPRRRLKVVEVAEETMAGYRVHDELSVVRMDGPIREERLP